MADLFSYGDVRNKPSRSGFDLSNRICFSSKAGELLPLYSRFCYPGDKFTLKHQIFTRTQPVNTAAYTRIREYVDWYFVPLRLMSKSLASGLMQLQNNPVQGASAVSSREVISQLPYLPLFGTVAGDFSGVIGLDTIPMFQWYLGAGDDYPGGEYVQGIRNFFGFNDSALTVKLIQYLQYGKFIGHKNPIEAQLKDAIKDERTSLTYGFSDSSTVDLDASENLNVNLLPFFAYQKIYADFFRDTQWEENKPYTYNFDWYTSGNFFAGVSSEDFLEYLNDDNAFTLRYANWPKDMFMGVLPSSQIGDVAVVDITSNIPSDLTIGYGDNKLVKLQALSAPNNWDVKANGIYNGAAEGSSVVLKLDSTGSNTVYTGIGVPVDAIASSFNILQLRMAEAVQRFKEVSQCADQTARDQIYAHFGVSISGALSDKSIYIGGSAGNLDISEVVNTNLTGGAVADIQGKGIGSGVGMERFSTDEYGVLMCIYHAVPLLDYVITGQRKELTYIDLADIPLPDFDNLGMESINFGQFINDASLKELYPNVDYYSSVLGYLPRFYELKTDVDKVYGAFTTTLKNWVAPLSPSNLKSWLYNSSYDSAADGTLSINYGFFKVNPSVLDSIFNVACDSSVDTDQFLSSIYFDVKAVRNFDYDGMPY